MAVDRSGACPLPDPEDELDAVPVGDEGGKDERLDETRPEPSEPASPPRDGPRRRPEGRVGVDTLGKKAGVGEGGDELGQGRAADGLSAPRKAQRVEEENELAR